MGATKMSEDSEAPLQPFEDARQTLRSYAACKEELLWRMAHRFPPNHKLRKTVERLLFGGLDPFQSRADDCACGYAAGMPGRDFLGYDTPVDVFYGSSLSVPTRVDEWRAVEGQRLQRADGKRARYPAYECRLAPLDLELLEHVGAHAFSFMREVRALPCFRPRWNGKQPRKEGFVVCTSSLDECEAKFNKKYAAARQICSAQPLENE